MNKAERKIYENMGFFKQAEYDSLAQSRNHWLRSAEITEDKERKKLYKDYARKVEMEMKEVLNIAEVS